MCRSLIVTALLVLAGFCPDVRGQSGQSPKNTQDSGVNNQQIVNLPRTPHTYKPKLLMQDAMKVADDFIRKQHIDISSYWLSQINFTLYGDKNTADKDKIPCWYFWWMSETAAAGDYIEIFVDMDGRAWRVPSM